MPRPIWKGSVSFGLVNIPVKLFAATQSQRIAFHEIEAGTGQRIRHKRVAEKSGREVPYDHIVKGFEWSRGQTVILTDDELATAEPAHTRAIAVEQFVDLQEIDPISYESSYFVVPDGEAAARAYVLLQQTMKQRGRVAIGRFVLRSKQYLVCLRPYENVIALETLYFADELRSPQALPEVPARQRVTAQELAMAGQLVDGLTKPWDPTAYRDTFREEVLKLVSRKAKGQEIAAPPAAQRAEVVDLMSALKASLERKGTHGGRKAQTPQQATTGGRHRRAAAPSRAARHRHRAATSTPRKARG